MLHKMRVLARRVGVEALHANIDTIPEWRIAHLLKLFRIDTVLDVGANTGQFAQSLRASGYSGRIVSFEPLPEAHKALGNAASKDPDWILAASMALGAKSAVQNFHVAGNSVSSSLREMADLHVEGAPESREVATIRVNVEPLDKIVADYVGPDACIFMKIDTQGTEDAVLAGAVNTLPRIYGLMVELSLAELYSGQSLLPQTYGAIEALGFECWDITPGFRNLVSGRLLQVDAIFFRRSATER